MKAARPLPGVGQLAQRGLELLLGLVDPPARGVDARAARAAEREQGHVVVGARERLEHVGPLDGPLGVARQLARLQQRAADVGERLQRRRLAARHGGHRLVEVRQAFLDAAARDLREPELRERARLEVGVPRRRRATSSAAWAWPAAACGSGERCDRASSSHPCSVPGARPRAGAPPARASRSPRPGSRRRARTPATATTRSAPRGQDRRPAGSLRRPARGGRRRRAGRAATTARDRGRRAPRDRPRSRRRPRTPGEPSSQSPATSAVSPSARRSLTSRTDTASIVTRRLNGS